MSCAIGLSRVLLASLVVCISIVYASGMSKNADASDPNFSTISGRIIDQSGNPISGASVLTHDDGCCWWPGALTDGAGTYVIRDLRPGDHILYSYANGYATTYWNSSGGSLDEAQAQTVHVNDTNDGERIELSDMKLPRLATMNGRVTDSGGNPLEGAPVTRKVRAAYA